MHKVCSQSGTGIKPIDIGLWDQHLATWPSCLIVWCTDYMDTAVCLYHFNRSSMKQIGLSPNGSTLYCEIGLGEHLHQCIKFAARHERGPNPQSLVYKTNTLPLGHHALAYQCLMTCAWTWQSLNAATSKLAGLMYFISGMSLFLEPYEGWDVWPVLDQHLQVKVQGIEAWTPEINIQS